MSDKTKILKAEMTANEIYAEWQIPRKLLNMAVNAPCPIRVREETTNGVTRKWYTTSDVIDYFGADMTNRILGVSNAEK